MPIIKLTQDDINRAKQPDAGWFRLKLTEVSEKPSKDKKSINYNFDFEIIDAPAGAERNVGRHAYTMCNSKAPGIMLMPLCSAIYNIPIDEITPDDVNTDKWIGKTLFGEVTEETFEGKIVKRLNTFSPDENPPF